MNYFQSTLRRRISYQDHILPNHMARITLGIKLRHQASCRPTVKQSSLTVARRMETPVSATL